MSCFGKFFGPLALAVLYALPSYAVTYSFDYSIKGLDYIKGGVERNSAKVLGFVETDGTLGVIDETSILSWRFLAVIEKEDKSQFASTLGSPVTFDTSRLSGGFENNSNAGGTFLATDSTLTAIGYYYFTEFVDVRNDQGDLIDNSFSAIFGTVDVDGVIEAVDIKYGETCVSTINCDTMNTFPSLTTPFTKRLATFRGAVAPAVAPAVVPLPASLPLLLAGIGAFVAIRRKTNP